jgi:hypothetical protein
MTVVPPRKNPSRKRVLTTYSIGAVALAAVVAVIALIASLTGGARAEADETPAASDTAQEWANTTFGDFAAETHRGEGNALIPLPDGARAGLLTARHTGDGDFWLTLRGADNERTGEQPVVTTGDYQGTTVWGIHNNADATALQVTADGAWTITIAPINAAKDLPATGHGLGDAVFLHDGTARALTATHEGTGVFTVTSITEDPLATTALATHTGPFTGTAHIGSMPTVIAVTSTGGSWHLSLH